MNDYVNIGFQYYLSARFATLHFMLPVGGNLFHHALEMVLKAYLQQHYSDQELRRMGHHLPTLWEAFQDHVGDANLQAYNDLIEKIQKWEEIRYCQLNGQSVSMGIGLDPGTTLGQSDADRSYELPLPELDQFMSHLIRIAGFERYASSFFRSFRRLDAYVHYNRQPLVGTPNFR